jgi:hypothetical protein
MRDNRKSSQFFDVKPDMVAGSCSVAVSGGADRVTDRQSKAGPFESRSRTTRAGRVALGALATGAILFGQVSAAPRVAADGTGMSKIANVELWGAGARETIVDPSARRVIVFCNECDKSPIAARSYDADTMKPVADLKDPLGFFGAASDHAYTLDVAHHHLFKLANNGTNAVARSSVVAVIDTLTMKLLSSYNVSIGERFGGLFYSSKDNVLYTVDKGTNSPYEVQALDPDSGQVLWERYLYECAQDSAVPANNFPLALGVSGDAKNLYTICEPHPGDGSSGARVGIDVVRLALPADARSVAGPATAVAPVIYNGAADLFPGIVDGGGGFFFDSIWLPGIDRLAALVPGGDGGAGLIVFDSATATYVSAPTLFSTGGIRGIAFNTPALGIDPSTGRVFAHSFAYTSGGCPNQVGGSNGFATAEAALNGNATTISPSGDPTLTAFLHGGSAPMGYDPVRRNLWMADYRFIPSAKGCDATTNLGLQGSSLAIYHDGLAPASLDKNTNVDASTVNVAEATGVTGANVGALASAFGARYQMAPSGVEGPLTGTSVNGQTLTCQNASSFYLLGTAYTVGQKDSPPVPPAYQEFCNSGARTATFASVVRADAIAGDTNRDSASNLANGTDFSSPGPYVDRSLGYVGLPKQCLDPGGADRCAVPEQYRPYATGEALPWEPATCEDTGDNQADINKRNALQIGSNPAPDSSQKPLVVPGNAPGASEAECLYQANLAKGSATTTGPGDTSVGYPVFAQDASSVATVQRTSKEGSVAIATSIADGIDIAGVLHIGRLEVSATAKAHGRPGTTVATYTCTVTGLTVTLPTGAITVPTSSTVPGKLQGAGLPVAVPGSADCSDPAVQQDIALVNHAFNGSLILDMPVGYSDASKAPGGADGVVVQASHGGYLAQVQASALRRNQNNILLNDRALEQPGLVVTAVDDTAQRHSRFVATFAAVAASATYGIYLLPPNDDSFDGGPAGDLGANSSTVPETGVSPESSTLQSTAAAVGPGGGGGNGGLVGAITRAYQAVVDGIRVLMQHPGLIAPLAAVWVLLGLPFYLVSRRRALLMNTR